MEEESERQNACTMQEEINIMTGQNGYQNLTLIAPFNDLIPADDVHF